MSKKRVTIPRPWGEVGVKWTAGEECMEGREAGEEEKKVEEGEQREKGRERGRQRGRRVTRGRGCGKSRSVLTGGAAGKHQVIVTTPAEVVGREVQGRGAARWRKGSGIRGLLTGRISRW